MYQLRHYPAELFAPPKIVCRTSARTDVGLRLSLIFAAKKLWGDGNFSLVPANGEIPFALGSAGDALVVE